MNLFCLKLKQLSQSDLFNADGNLTENRPQLFEQLEDLIHLLDEAMLEARSFVDRLDIQLKIKYGVLKKPKNFLTLRSDVNEMRSKMEGSSFLTVVIDEFNEELFPVGIISASDLVKEKLATVSFRDFSTFDEIKMADHFEVISIIDHHKSNIRLNNVASIITGDVQSCNILLAEQAFLINDQYSTIGMSLNDIESQIANLKGREDLLSLRLLKKLYMRKQNCLKKSSYYINPAREYCEYLSFLHAILDDTDLLTKVSIRDLRCIAELLNRLKSLYLRKETEIISLDEITLDNNFIKEASNLILKQSDMYSIYKQIYSLREKSVEENIQQCIEGKDSNIFIDTKEQNGCARVGQTKVFSQNFAFYSQKSSDLQKIWIAKAHHLHQKNHSLDLFIHMISTIASAEEVYASEETSYHHLDELWIWTPGNIMGMTHLNSFLANFSQKLTANTSKLEIQLHGKPDTELAKIFRQHFQATNINYINDDLNQMDGLAVIHFDAGAVNSRKTMISPFLPRIPR